MRKWTLMTALGFLNRESGVTIQGKRISTQNGFKGLKACSACDYLVNYHKFIY